MNEFRTFYLDLAKPEFAPPPEMFGWVWSVVYPLIVVGGLILLVQAVRGKLSPWLFGLYAGNVILNLVFTPVTLWFGLASGSIVIMLVWGSLLYLEITLMLRSLALFLLFLPYLLWVTYATVLQMFLLVLN